MMSKIIWNPFARACWRDLFPLEPSPSGFVFLPARESGPRKLWARRPKWANHPSTWAFPRTRIWVTPL